MQKEESLLHEMEKGKEGMRIDRKLHQTIKGVTEDVEHFSFNTAIAKLMELTNVLYEYKDNPTLISHSSLVIRHLLQLLSPFAPFITEELWQKLGNTGSIHEQPWPIYDPELAKESELTIPVQINGKLRDTLTVATDASDDQIKEKALASEKVQALIAGKTIIKTIVVPKKLVNIVVK